MCGLRAWCFLCPVFSRVSIGIITTAITLMAALMSEALTTSKDLVHLSKRYTSLLWARCIGQEADTIRARVNIDETDESPSTEAQDCGRTSIIITPLRKRILFVASAIVGAITLFTRHGHMPMSLSSLFLMVCPGRRK